MSESSDLQALERGVAMQAFADAHGGCYAEVRQMLGGPSKTVWLSETETLDLLEAGQVGAVFDPGSAPVRPFSMFLTPFGMFVRSRGRFWLMD